LDRRIAWLRSSGERFGSRFNSSVEGRAGNIDVDASLSSMDWRARGEEFEEDAVVSSSRMADGADLPKPSPLDELLFFLLFLAERASDFGRFCIDDVEGVTNAQHVDNGSRVRKRMLGEDFIVSLLLLDGGD